MLFKTWPCSDLENLNFRQKMRAYVDRYHDTDVIVVEESSVTPSPAKSMVVKVRCRSTLRRLPLRKVGWPLQCGSSALLITPKLRLWIVLYNVMFGVQGDSFSVILNELAQAEGVTADRCVLLLQDKILQPYDTPATVNLHIADILGLFYCPPVAFLLTCKH